MLLSFICAQEEKWAWLGHFIAGLLCPWLWKLPLQGPGASAQLLGALLGLQPRSQPQCDSAVALSLGMQGQVFLHLFFEELKLGSFLPPWSPSTHSRYQLQDHAVANGGRAAGGFSLTWGFVRRSRLPSECSESM